MKKETNSPSLFGSVMLAYFIVVLHVLLVAGLGVLILFFRGAVTYMPLILLAGLSIVCASVYYLFRRFKSLGRNSRNTLNSPLFKGKSIEVDLLGGAVSIRINPNNNATTLPAIDTGDRTPLLEDRKSERIRYLVDLARSLEKDHIDQKATEKTGRNLFN